MPTTRMLLSVSLLAVGASATGCKQYYNGALGLGGEDYAAVRAYHEHMADREQTLVDQELAESQARQASQNNQANPTPAGNRVGPDGQTVPIQHPAAAPVQHAQPDYESDLEQALADQQRSATNLPDRGEFVSTSEVAPQPTPEASPDAATDAHASDAHTPTPPSKTRMNPVGVFGELPEADTDVSPMDTTGQIERVSSSEEGADFDVTTDPTGQWLLFSSTRHRETADIYRQRVGGAAVTQLTDDPANDMMPSISPSGKHIAFTSDRSGNWDIYLMEADGGPAVQITADATHDIHPSFSPDGKHLVYCSYGERSGQWQMVVVDVDNPASKRYIGHGLFPQWSPGGDTILFQRARERGTRWFSVWTVELDERGEAGSPTEIAWSPEFACITPSWSPDGSHVVFCTVSDPEADSHARPIVSDVWVVDSNGGGRTRLTQGRFSNLQPVWSASGSIYFVSNRSRQGVENIYALNPEDAVRLASPKAGEPENNPTVSVPTDSD